MFQMINLVKSRYLVLAPYIVVALLISLYLMYHCMDYYHCYHHLRQGNYDLYGFLTFSIPMFILLCQVVKESLARKQFSGKNIIEKNGGKETRIKIYHNVLLGRQVFELGGENDISSYEVVAILTRVSPIIILLIPTKSSLLSLIFICIE